MDDGSEVLKALADPTRRAILDALFADDGQTLGQLEDSRLLASDLAVDPVC